MRVKKEYLSVTRNSLEVRCETTSLLQLSTTAALTTKEVKRIKSSSDLNSYICWVSSVMLVVSSSLAHDLPIPQEILVQMTCWMLEKPHTHSLPVAPYRWAIAVHPQNSAAQSEQYPNSTVGAVQMKFGVALHHKRHGRLLVCGLLRGCA